MLYKSRERDPTTTTERGGTDHAHAHRPVPRTGPAHPAGTRHRRPPGRDAHGRLAPGRQVLHLPGPARHQPGLHRPTVEQNVLTVRAERGPAQADGAQMIVAERPYGTFTRQVFLGETLDAESIAADYAAGVLTLTIPVREAAKPRTIQVTSSEARQAVNA